MTIDGAHFDDLAAELDRALSELSARVGADEALWARGKPGKWTVGQHVEHLALCMAETARSYEQRTASLRAGSLAPRPRRGLLERLWVALVVGRGILPRGGRTPGRFEPSAHPDREETLARVRREADRHRTLGLAVDGAERDRLWAPNPFMPAWHYTLPEIVRASAVHVRHHARQIAEVAASEPAVR